MTNGYRVAVVGATGVVGRTVLRVLEERADRFPVADLVPFASPRSVGTPIPFRDKHLLCRALDPEAVEGFHLVFSSAGGEISLEWAEQFARHGAVVIDKSSAFRTYENEPYHVPLVVPQVNPDAASLAFGEQGRRIIATPNCSTTQLVVALKPLLDVAPIARLVIATYQAVSGTGQRAVDELGRETRELIETPDKAPKTEVYPHQIAFNALPEAGTFLDDGRTDEEEKLRYETKRILGQPDIRISATCVRVPVATCHSEAINIEFDKAVGPTEIRERLEAADGVVVADDPGSHTYPLAIDAAGKDDVFVGRIRQDPDCNRAIDLWVVADNLRKGAATNAVEIAELLHKEGLLPAQRGHSDSREPLHA